MNAADWKEAITASADFASECATEARENRFVAYLAGLLQLRDPESAAVLRDMLEIRLPSALLPPPERNIPAFLLKEPI
jgi:hypothetical protein